MLSNPALPLSISSSPCCDRSNSLSCPINNITFFLNSCAKEISVVEQQWGLLNRDKVVTSFQEKNNALYSTLRVRGYGMIPLLLLRASRLFFHINNRSFSSTIYLQITSFLIRMHNPLFTFFFISFLITMHNTLFTSFSLIFLEVYFWFPGIIFETFINNWQFPQ